MLAYLFFCLKGEADKIGIDINATLHMIKMEHVTTFMDSIHVLAAKNDDVMKSGLTKNVCHLITNVIRHIKWQHLLQGKEDEPVKIEEFKTFLVSNRKEESSKLVDDRLPTSRNCIWNKTRKNEYTSTYAILNQCTRNITDLCLFDYRGHRSLVKKDREKLLNNFASDLAARCKSEFTLAMEIYGGDFGKVQNKISITADAIPACSTGNYELCRRHYFVCQGGKKKEELENAQAETDEDLVQDDQDPFQISQPIMDGILVQNMTTNDKIPQNVHQPSAFQFNKSVNSPFTLKKLVPTENNCIRCDVKLRRQNSRSIQFVFMNKIDTVAVSLATVYTNQNLEINQNIDEDNLGANVDRNVEMSHNISTGRGICHENAEIDELKMSNLILSPPEQRDLTNANSPNDS
ncbi:unnamed protein product [Mytilus coruscus]|uniref:Uncharacterized protein n=1 Tax=Mytilus coruscus TaxID=42192 RepID=A0A6J8EA53_MYTCO|nr:unnamed protein product [Mytilus coruscus]